MGEDYPGRERCYPIEEVPAIADLSVGDCAQIDLRPISGEVEVDEAESAACPNDTSRLTPEVPTLPATEVAQLESRDLMFEFVQTESDFG
ncbi:MAG: hypothetical protein GY798_32360, partial [Hyphomicrobiales bacterium]|nr:hypothetical protein [Hyphomicrobiales bacterium]